MQYGISQADAEEILNRSYNLTQLRNNPLSKLNKIFSEDKVRVWKEKIKRFKTYLNNIDFICN